MKICIVGTGYVGLVTAACLSDVGNEIVGIDKDDAKIKALRNGKIPIFEPSLEPLIIKNIKEGRLRFTNQIKEGLKGAEFCFICVDTPSAGDGKANISNVLAVARAIGQSLSQPIIVVTKSTVPVGTTHKIKAKIQEGLRLREKPVDWAQVASNPEFLKEGSAVDDCMKPERIIVGTENPEVAEKLHNLYRPFTRKMDRFLAMDIASSELTKYACNSMLATRISFMNELARLAEKIGASISSIREAMGRDSRIGPDFLYAGIGYGGSCFPKDIKALIETGKEKGAPLSLLSSVDEVNESQKKWFWEKVESFFEGKLENKLISIWGGAFKANTDDIRYSPALYIIDKILGSGGRVNLFDPVAMDKIREVYSNQIQFSQNIYNCVEGSDALVIATDWREFGNPDFEKIKSLMKSSVIFDGRNLYSARTMEEKGFHYFGVGLPQLS